MCRETTKRLRLWLDGDGSPLTTQEEHQLEEEERESQQAVMFKGGGKGLGLSCEDDDGFFGVALGWFSLFCWKLLLCQSKCLWGRSDTINLPSLKAGVQKCSATSHSGDW